MNTTKTISNQDDTIDSRDVIARIEEIYGHADSDGHIEPNAMNELLHLERLAIEGADYSSDWEYGAQLIKDDYFTSYIKQLIKDCYEMPEGLKSGQWPYHHMKMDYEAAAEEAKQDYTTVSFDGVNYWIRSA